MTQWLEKPCYYDFYCGKCQSKISTGYFSTQEWKNWIGWTEEKEKEANLRGQIHEWNIYIPSPFERIEEVCGGTWYAYNEKATENQVGYTNTKEQEDSKQNDKESIKEVDKIRSLVPASVGERKIKVLSYKVLFKEQTLEGLNYNIQRIEELIRVRKQKPGYSVRHVKWMEGIVKKLKALKVEKESNKEWLL